MNASATVLLIAFLSVSALPPRAAAAIFTEREYHPQTVSLDAEENRAYLWSLGGTVLPLAAAIGIGLTDAGDDLAAPLFILGAGAVTVGPSLGQFKAGSVGHGVAATVLRGAGEAIAIVAILRSICIMCDAEVAAAKPSAAGGLAAGTALYLAGTVYSLIDIHRTYDARRKAALSSLRLSPTLALDRENRVRPGMLAELRF